MKSFFLCAYVRARYARSNFNFIIYDKKSVNGTMGDIAIAIEQNITKIEHKSISNCCSFPSKVFRLCFGICFPLNGISAPELRPNAREHWTDFVRLCFTVNVIVSWNFDFVRICCFFILSILNLKTPEWSLFKNRLIRRLLNLSEKFFGWFFFLGELYVVRNLLSM